NSSDESVATVSSTGVITAEGPGSANITATSTIAGVTRTGTIAVSVSPLHYNFWKLANNGVQAEGKTPIADVTEFKHTTKDDPAEIWPNSSIVTDPWHYVDKNATQFEFTHDLSALTLQGPTGSWARLKVRVTQPGLYRASSVNALKT